jgi:DNA-binding NarL/FixJ family response regulator
MADTESNATLTLLIAEDDPLLREMLAQWLQAETDLDVVGTVRRGQDVLAAAVRFRPQLLLLDLRLPGSSGLEVLDALATQEEPPKVLVISGDESEQTQLEVAQRGARGFLPRSEAVSLLPEALRTVARGGLWFSRALTTRIFEEYQGLQRRAKAEQRSDPQLSEPEREVLTRIARGLTNGQIARDLQMSVHTVKRHVANLLRKLGLPGRTEAAVYAARKGLLDSEAARRSKGGGR